MHFFIVYGIKNRRDLVSFDTFKTVSKAKIAAYFSKKINFSHKEQAELPETRFHDPFRSPPPRCRGKAGSRG